MKIAAQALEFEKAAVLRDQIVEMRQIMIFKDVTLLFFRVDFPMVIIFDLEPSHAFLPS